MATNYKGYTQSQYDNQSKYLNNLINSGSAGQKAWAQNELASLNSQYTPSASTTPSTGNSTVSSGGSTVSSGSSKGSSSSGSSGKASGSSSSKTNYGNYTQSQYDNQSNYLNNLIAQGGGNAVWAQQELDSLNSQYKPSASSSSSSGNTNYSGYTQAQYDNQSKYLENLIAQGGGNASWAQQELANLNSQYKPVASTTPTAPTVPTTPTKPQWDTTGWDVFTGADGIQYSISPVNGTIIALQNGTQTRYLPTDANYNSQYAAMQQQIGNAYTPYYSWTDANGNNVTTKNYLLGNSDLKYALEQYMSANNSDTYDVEGYAKDLYNRVGTQRADGSFVTLNDVNAELNRLGLSDYNSENVYYTAGGNLIPKNEFTTTKQGAFGSNSGDSTWVSYGGQDYLVGGDSANFVDYVNGKTGNITNADLLFNNMASNPYAQQDPAFMAQYNQALNNFYNSGGSTIIPTTPSVGTVPGASTGSTGYEKVDQLINLINSTNNYNGAVSNMGGVSLGNSSIWNDIQALLQGGLDSQKQFLANQKTQAELDAENLMRQAYVNQQLQGDGVREALSAAGLGTSGALQSAQLGVQNNYNNSLANINNSLQQMIASLNEAELQALIDHTNNMTNYAYQIQNDEQDRAYQNAQLYMQQMEHQRAQEQQKWENLYKQAQADLLQQQYEDETRYARNQESAAYYAQLANAGAITMAEYQQKLRELGLI